MEKTRQLIFHSQQGDANARSQLVEDNMPLVISIVRRFLRRGLEYDDLVQIGCLGLLKAINDFDLDYQVRFSTYAVPKIMGEIRQELRQSSLLKVARPLKRLAALIIESKDQLTQEWGRSPTIQELADHLQLAREEVVTALEAVAPVAYLQEKVTASQEQPLELQDLLASPPDQEKFLIKQALQKLAPAERRLVLLRYFAEKSQSEVARALGISQAQVSRIEARIMRALRHEI